MAQLRHQLRSLTKRAATLSGVAALAVGLATAGALADGSVSTPSRTLASELRILRGDLDRLTEEDLPPAHRDGLRARIVGALGLLPWLLKSSGDEAGSAALSSQGTTPEDFARLGRDLDAVIARHPLDLIAEGTEGVSAKALLEARAIHETYCAGCHDGSGNGDPEATLPIRDLFGMARAEPEEVFVARLYNGIKGDETIGFRNPLTEAQFRALWRYYSTD